MIFLINNLYLNFSDPLRALREPSAPLRPPMFVIIQNTVLCYFIFRIIDLIIQVKKDESFLRLSNPWYTVAEIWPHPFYLFEFEQNVRNTELLVYPEYPDWRKNEGRFFT